MNVKYYKPLETEVSNVGIINCDMEILVLCFSHILVGIALKSSLLTKLLCYVTLYYSANVVLLRY